MKELNKILIQYRKIDTIPSIEEERRQMYAYVYATNKLEGNKLTLSQTTQLLSSDTISGEHVKTKDILEQKGMYKALSRMLKAVRENEKLSIELILELNWLTLSYLWKYEDSYVNAKSKGQKEGEFKISKNKIEVTNNGKFITEIVPLSTPNAVQNNMDNLIKLINQSNKSTLKKAVYLAQELWLHQPFVDGNKRTGRLLINFLLMKEGYPLFIFDSKNNNYNALLVEQYMDGKENLVFDYISKMLKEQMEKTILAFNKLNRNKNKGFRMIL
jgi:Fic family protein